MRPTTASWRKPDGTTEVIIITGIGGGGGGGGGVAGRPYAFGPEKVVVAAGRPLAKPVPPGVPIVVKPHRAPRARLDGE